MKRLSKVSTEYIAAEDRIRLTGLSDGDATVELWLTRRLLNLVMPHILKWLSETVPAVPRREVLQSFAQQAARAELKHQPAVRAKPQHLTWLVHTIDITPSKTSITLAFKSQKKEAAGFSLGSSDLRQWLNIVFDAYRSAEWGLDIWPEWIAEASPQEKPVKAKMN